MLIKDIEQEIKQREAYLTRCFFCLETLNLVPDSVEKRDALQLLEQEAFFLRDQLDRYNSVYAILREEQGSNDEMLQKV